jgi:hypothetical protein
MPLDGDDEAGVFAIMLPQKTDRSLNGLEAYRFYEISDGLANNLMLLTLRNSDRDAGTLETVLEVLPLQERLEIAQRLTNRHDSPERDSVRPTSRKSIQEQPLLSTPRSQAGSEGDAEGLQDARLRKRRKTSSKTTPVPKLAENAYQDTVMSKQLQDTAKSFSPPIDYGGHLQSRRQDSSEAPVPETISLDLTNNQAKQVYLIWPVRDAEDDMDYEFVHTLDETKTLMGLIALLEEDTEAIPSVAEIVARTKTWRLTYHGAGGANKAIVARKGSEVAFDRLQTTLAQLPVWKDSLARVHIELKSLSRPDSAAAT